MNQVTAWLDASMIYGSSKEESNDLRDLFNPGIIYLHYYTQKPHHRVKQLCQTLGVPVALVEDVVQVLLRFTNWLVH